MFEWPALGALVAVALPVAVIFLVLGVFRIVQRQAERAVRSPEYWDEVPDGKRYPTGWGEEQPSSEQASEAEPGQGPAEPASEEAPEPDTPQGNQPRGDAPQEDER